MTRRSVLFVCVHNAGRSQMAEGVNHVAVAAMAEEGIEIVRPIRDEIRRRVEALVGELLP